MKLRVFLPALDQLRADTELRYAVLQERGSTLTVAHEGEALLSQLPRHESCELILAASDALLHTVRVPKLTGAKLRAALPGLIEEQWLGDIDSAFIALGPMGGNTDQTTTLIAVDKPLLQRALHVFAAANHKVRAVTVAPLVLPHSPGQWSVSLDSQDSSVRTGAATGMALTTTVEPQQATPVPVQLQLAVANAASKPGSIQVYAQDTTINPADWQQTLNVPVQLAQTNATNTRGAAAPIGLNLLQYEFAPNIADWRAWRPAMVLAGLLAVVGISGLNLQAWQLQKQSSALQDRMMQTVTNTFPKITTVVDPLVQMRQQVEQMRTGAGAQNNTDFIPMTSALAQAVPDTDVVRQLEYSNSTLRARLTPAALETQAKKDALIQRLTGAGLSARFEADQLIISRGRL